MGHLLTYRKVNDWLNSKDDGDFVGYANNCGACPLAEFILETYPTVESVRLMPFDDLYDEYGGAEAHIYRSNNRHAVHLLPKWAARFMYSVDTLVEEEDGTPITVGEARSIIEEVYEPWGA